MRFSQKIGKTPIRSVLQVESIDEELLNHIWNVVLEEFLEKLPSSGSQYSDGPLEDFLKYLWKDFFHLPIDTIPKSYRTIYIEECIDFIRKWYFEKAKWFEIYDFLEFISHTEIIFNFLNFTKECNKILKSGVSGYRLINNSVLQITSEEEINEIESAINNTDKWKSVNTHLETSLILLADKLNPDYRNSIKESISAVESCCIIITGDNNTTLGKALTEIEKKHPIHGALKNAFSSIYGYTSDSGGIRHALLENNTIVEFEDSKFMLVACSAFINYLRAKLEI